MIWGRQVHKHNAGIHVKRRDAVNLIKMGRNRAREAPQYDGPIVTTLRISAMHETSPMEEGQIFTDLQVDQVVHAFRISQNGNNPLRLTIACERGDISLDDVLADLKTRLSTRLTGEETDAILKQINDQSFERFEKAADPRESLRKIHLFNMGLIGIHNLRSNIIGSNTINILLDTPQGVRFLFSAIFHGVQLEILHSEEQEIREAVVVSIQA